MVKITGSRRHTRRLARLPAATRKEVDKAIFAGADLIRVEARRLIADGAVQGAGHVPSKPGDPPNWDTGELANNITTAKTGVLKSETQSNADHSLPLEFGTEKMAERPFLRPATKAKRKDVGKLVAKAVNRAGRRS